MGASFGAFVAGPVGAALGAIGGPLAAAILEIVMDGVSEMGARPFSRRQQERIGAAALWALQGIEGALANGRLPRSDLVGRLTDHRTAHEEVLEGALLLARDAFEERRVRHLGAFYARFAFMEDVSPTEAHHLLRVAERLTYRQMVLLRVLSGAFTVDLGSVDYHDVPEATMSLDTHSVLQEAYELYGMGLIARPSGDGNYFALLGGGSIAPAALRPTRLGGRLAEMLAVDQVDATTLAAAIASLNPAGRT